MTAHTLSESTTTVNGCDLTSPTRSQTSEQACSVLASNRRPSAPYSCNTPQCCSGGRVVSRGQQNMRRHHWHTPKISQKFVGEWKFGLQCYVQDKTARGNIQLRFSYFTASSFKALCVYGTFLGRRRKEML